MQIYTSCYDGLIRLMDAEKEIFDMVYNGENKIYASHRQRMKQTVYILILDSDFFKKL
ncbi:drought sensitive protein, putative [Medicago truncatula]|uniref:Drought sensitive protein, putative n=1 Tax=Medicago truncatula TaxID=3880 RepID=G7K604_MEDTR|nr:drought sensitive protein, putative [Medicago truncatula]